MFGARCVDAILSGRDGPEPTGALGGLDAETPACARSFGGPRRSPSARYLTAIAEPNT